MPNSIESRNRRPSARRFGMPAAVAGAALLGLSLLLFVGPALGAANHSSGNGAHGSGNGTSGVLKIHDATTGAETSGNGNEPQVCDFWLGFTSDTSEVGTWIVVSWAPTGDGSTVASGAYNTSGDGADSSNIIQLPAGHYRAEWAAAGETVTNKKTFWVDAGCNGPPSPAEESQAEDPAPPTDAPGSPAEESQADEPASPAEESAAEKPTSPVEEPALPGGEPPSEESAPTEDESPAEQPAAPSGESPAEESVLSNEGSSPEDPGTPSDESPADDSPAEEPASQAEEPVNEDPGSPSDESPATPGDPSEAEQAAAATDPGTTDSPASPMQDQLGGTGTSREPTMSDTAAPTLPVQGGLVVTLGLLLLIVAHATTRRGKLGDARA